MSDYPVGADVWQWPSFKAFARRLGIDWDSTNTTRLVIDITHDMPVTITETRLAEDCYEDIQTKETMNNDMAPPIEYIFADNPLDTEKEN